MKINSFSTEQFAGIKDKQIDFADGINVVFGDNESGKTTIINAIYRTLTQPLKISKASKDGKAFVEQCFPSNGANAIFSKLSFTDNSSPYTVEKEWDKNGKESRIRVKLPDRSIITGISAEQKLRGLLAHPNAVYDNLIFGRQNNSEQILDWCYDFFSTKPAQDGTEEIRSRVAQALSAASGISSEKLCKMLDDIIDEKSKLWDFSQNAPKNGRMDWQKGQGAILRKYYDYINSRNELEKQYELRTETERYSAALSECEEKKKDLKLRLDELEKLNLDIANAEKLRRAREQQIQMLEDIKAKIAFAEATEKNLSEVQKLIVLKNEFLKRKEKAEKTETLNKIKALNSSIKHLTEKTQNLSSVTEDSKTAKSLLDKIERNKAKLGAGKLHAQFRMQSPHTANVEFADNSVQELSEGGVDINGFFRINIPNVGEITVSPYGVDVEKLLAENNANEQQLRDILAKYSAENLEALQEKSEEYIRNINELKTKHAARDVYKVSAAELENEISEITTDESINIPENIQQQVAEFLNRNRQSSLEEVKARFEANIDGFNREFGSRENALKTIDSINAELQKQDNLPDIPMSKEEFERKKAQLSREIELINAERDEANRNLGRLDSEIKDISEISETTEKLRAKWENEVHLCKCYMRIRDDYRKLLDSNQNDKYADFNEKFIGYLKYIAGDELTSDGIKNNLVFTSSGNPINSAEMLSEGTKETVLLAFRLAVLEFFFPNGDGLIVLDDILLDMDAKRREKSVRLLYEFAKKNQVILVTCDENIAEIMGGNKIVIAR